MLGSTRCIPGSHLDVPKEFAAHHSHLDQRVLVEAFICAPSTTSSFYWTPSDPSLHIDIGAAVRKFRYEDILIIGTGGTVHNLYRNAWSNVVIYRDNFAQQVPPEQWALDFRTEAEDALTKNSVCFPCFRIVHPLTASFLATSRVPRCAGRRCV